MITQDAIKKIRKKFQLHAKDTGSADVQIALLTERINSITSHMQQFKKDHASRKSLLQMVGHRRKLLDYLNITDTERYHDILKKLNLRK